MEYLVVVLVFIVFLQTRLTDLSQAVYCLCAQSALLAGACFFLGLSSGEGIHAVLPALLTLAVKVLFIPAAILRLVHRITDKREIISGTNVSYSSLAAVVALVLGYWLSDSLMPFDVGVGRDVLAATFFMIMTGLSLMVIRRRAVMQIVGLITLENGIYLLGLLMTEGLPLVVELGVFIDVLIAVIVLVILTSRMRLSFMTTDTRVMKKLKG